MHNPFNLKQYKVAAYITAYEDSEAVSLCVQAIKSQSFPVKNILIVDNSKKKSIFKLELNAENLVIKHYPENIGVAGGFSLAIAWAIEEGYDFLWTFDQDSIVRQDCLGQLLLVYTRLNNSNYSIGIVAPTAIDLRTGRLIDGAVFDHDRFTPYKPPNYEQPFECDSPITSGSLISLVAAQTVSLPCTDLFIDGIDFDYGMQLKQKGFHNLIVPQAIMEHKFGTPIKVKWFKRELVFQQYTPLRHYYICRNHTYLETRYAQGWYRMKTYLWRTKFLLKTIIQISLYEAEDKHLKIWACLLGTCHGLRGKLGRNF
uniref:glycosyltransferase family 2 protein n=1 Tax=Trichocoleus desertorum TaxID=1481672 RepID=UPI0025B42BDE|nr:glycosyltransferase family 2 protein [Trichocoleus desertorum]